MSEIIADTISKVVIVDTISKTTIVDNGDCQ